MVEKKGFTLVELLVVIAIIAILATVVFLNVQTARGKANDTKVATNLATTQKIASQCIAEESTLNLINGRAPSYTSNICTDSVNFPGTWPSISGRGSDGGTWRWFPNLAQYFVNSNNGQYKFSALSRTTALNVICTETGCKKTGF